MVHKTIGKQVGNWFMYDSGGLSLRSHFRLDLIYEVDTAPSLRIIARHGLNVRLTCPGESVIC